MTPLRWLIVCFWVFVVGMLVLEFHESDVKRQEQAVNVGGQYLFTPPDQKPAPVPNTEADVRQITYIVQQDVPGPGNFTCQVTLKNVGGTTARHVQIQVRPFLGARTGSDNIGHTPYGFLSENDPLSQMVTSLSFPDLEPGQESTQSTVFLSHANVNPGNNPKPEISFESGKASP